MADRQWRAFDADNHYYEATDAFTRHIEPEYAKRTMQWAEVGGKTVLVNRSPNGQYEVYDCLQFHGGSGATLEMRVFSETAIREHLRAAGLHRIRIHASGSDRHGILSGECSVPIVASREPFVLTSSAITELTGQFTFNTRVLRMVRQSRWVRIGRFFGFAPGGSGCF